MIPPPGDLWQEAGTVNSFRVIQDNARHSKDAACVVAYVQQHSMGKLYFMDVKLLRFLAESLL